ncbi:MAG: peptidoglycan-binding domain-containing protein, partial [Burkholderiaceae bacterium]
EEPPALGIMGLADAALHRLDQLHFRDEPFAGDEIGFRQRLLRANLLFDSGRPREALGAYEELRNRMPEGAPRKTVRGRVVAMDSLLGQARAARQLMEFDVALDAMSQAMALQSQIGHRVWEMETRLRIARMQMLDIGDLRQAAELLQDGDDGSSREIPEVWLQHALQRATLASLRGETGHASALLAEAGEFVRQRPGVSQAARVKLALLGMRVGDPPGQAAHARDLCDLWIGMDYAGARLALATTLRHVPPLQRLPADLCRRLDRLTRLAPPRVPGQQRLRPGDRIRLSLLRVDLLRVIGQGDRAERELRALGYLMHQQPPGLWMRSVARCCDRLGLWPDELLPAGWFTRVVAGVRRSPHLIALIYLEAAERQAMLGRNPAKALTLLEHSSKAWNADKGPHSFLHVRRLSLRARLQDAQAMPPDDAARLLRRIAELRERLGLAPEAITSLPFEPATNSDAVPLHLPTLAVGLRFIGPADVHGVDHAANRNENAAPYLRDPESAFDQALGGFAHAPEARAYDLMVDAAFGRGREDFAWAMAEAALPPALRARLAAAERGDAAPLELIVEHRHKRLQAIPWELMAPGGPEAPESALPIALRPCVASFWRAPFAFSLKPRVAWAQRALNLLEGAGVNEDAHFGHRTMKALRRFQGSIGLSVTGVIDAPTIAALAQRLRASAAEPPPRRALLIAPDRETTIVMQRGAEASGASLEWIYRSHGLRVETLHEPDIGSLRAMLREPADVVHIACPIAQSRSNGGLSLQFSASNQEAHATAFVPSLLARLLHGHPLVVVDVPRSASAAETFMQLMLRNAFASQLFEHGELANLLAIGLARPAEQLGLCDTLVGGLGRRQPLLELVRGLRGLPALGSPADPTRWYATAGIALFSRDPCLAELPRARD